MKASLKANLKDTRLRSFASLLIAPLMILAATPAPAQQGNADPAPRAVPAASVERPTPPKLIVAISVDQFSADLFSEYRQLWTGGLARLAGGVVFPQGYQSHGATETCPGHSTILTGNYPAHTGIIANNWYDFSVGREDKRVYCSEDPSVAGSSSASGRYTASLNYLMVPTLGDRMRAANPATQVVSIAGKDRAALMMGGRQANELWWLAPTGLATLPGRQASPLITRISTAITEALARPRDPLPASEKCAARSWAVPLGNGQTVGEGRFGRAAGNFRGLMASPEADGYVLAAAAAVRADRHMGEGATTDLLIVGLSATDYVGHTYGTEGSEMCHQLLALDQELGDFFNRLDATGIDYAVVLTADHGGHDTPERNRANAAPTAQRVEAGVSAEALGQQIAQELRISVPGQLIYSDGSFGDFYVNPAVTGAQKARVIAAAQRILGQSPQVDRVVLGSALAAMPIPTGSPEQWTVEQRLRASYMAGRSGDFLVVLKPRVTPIPDTTHGYIATHGSVWDYDRRVPILFWRRGLAAFEQPNPVMTVDIMPTLAALIGLPVQPGSVDGRCLDIYSGPRSLCPVP